VYNIRSHQPEPKEATVKFTKLAIGIAAFSLIATCADAAVKWSDQSYDQILARAKQENKYVFIDFFATWCGPCKRMDEKTFTDAKVQDLLNSMIAADWDAEKDPHVDVAKKYKVSAYPTMIVIGPDGKEVDRHLGYLDAAEFITTIDGYRNGVGTIAALENQLKASPDNVELLYQVGTKHAEAGRSEEAAPPLNRVLKLDPNNTERNPEILYSLGEAYYMDGKYADAKPYFNRLVTDYKDSEIVPDGYKRLAGIEFKLGNNDAAVAQMEKTLTGKENDANTLNGFAWFCAQRKIGLDKALPVAQKAADLSGRDPGILDTLAEVYFARGEFDNAIKTEEEAAAKNPSDQYMKDQIAKFKKAKDGTKKQS
jgi:tetratricopeptide (TPR) repeat protein